MKKVLVVVLMFVLLAGAAFAQEKNPVAAVSFELGGGIIAPIGVGADFFLGRHLSLGAELRFLFLGAGGVLVGTLEPGAAVRFYFGELDSTLYLMGGCSYVTAFALGEESGTAPFGILKPKVGIGYSALFGKDNRTRFAIELGADYMWPVVEGDALELEAGDIFPILPHFMLMFGRVF